MAEERICAACGKAFAPRRASQKYCSPECRDAKYYTVACIVCGKPIVRPTCRMTQICGPDCYQSWQTLTRNQASGGSLRSKDGKPTLADIVLEASRHGMSYGEYVSKIK